MSSRDLLQKRSCPLPPYPKTPLRRMCYLIKKRSSLFLGANDLFGRILTERIIEAAVRGRDAFIRILVFSHFIIIPTILILWVRNRVIDLILSFFISVTETLISMSTLLAQRNFFDLLFSFFITHTALILVELFVAFITGILVNKGLCLLQVFRWLYVQSTFRHLKFALELDVLIKIWGLLLNERLHLN